MQEKIHPAPIWIEQDSFDHKDIRCDLYIDPQNPDGDDDLTLRFTVNKDDGSAYVALAFAGEAMGEVAIPEAFAVRVEAALDKAAALWRPYYEGARAFPADLEAALETGVAHVQALTDARRDGASMVETSILLEDWAVAAANLLPEDVESQGDAARAMTAYGLDEQAWDALPEAARAALIAAAPGADGVSLKAKADAYDRTVAKAQAYDARLNARQKAPEGNDYAELFDLIVPPPAP